MSYAKEKEIAGKRKKKYKLRGEKLKKCPRFSPIGGGFPYSAKGLIDFRTSSEKEGAWGRERKFALEKEEKLLSATRG